MKDGELHIVAAGIVLDEGKREVLLIKRADSMWDDLWSMPGGHIEYGETVEEALKRELKEELNLEVTNMKFLNYEEFMHPKKPGVEFISLNFLVFAKKEIKYNDEIKDARWFSLSELPKLKHRLPKAGMDALRSFL